MGVRKLGELELNRVHLGDCRETMRKMPGASVQCVVTSPPYLGLRHYKIPPSVWGGDSACEHDWDDGANKYEGHRGKRGQVAQTKWQKQDTHPNNAKMDVKEATCTKCGAWLGCLGLEPSPKQYVEHLVEVFREIRRVLRPDGVAWLNLGDSFAASGGSHAGRDDNQVGVGAKAAHEAGQADAGRRIPPTGCKPKDLIGVPWMVAFALRDDGWYLRSEIIWAKANCLPESVTDRVTRSHEQIFMLTKEPRYYYDRHAILEPFADSSLQRVTQPNFENQTGGPKDYGATGEGSANRSIRRSLENVRDNILGGGGRNKRSVWTIPSEPTPEAHFATFPSKLVEPCILASTSERGACPKCGAPLERIVDRDDTVPQTERRRKLAQSAVARNVVSGGISKSTLGAGTGGDVPATKNTTIGWQPTCECGPVSTVPCVVLDPFMGSGTTGKVAQDLGRDWIGGDMNPDYAKIAAKRTAQAGLLAWRPNQEENTDG